MLYICVAVLKEAYMKKLVFGLLEFYYKLTKLYFVWNSIRQCLSATECLHISYHFLIILSCVTVSTYFMLI